MKKSIIILIFSMSVLNVAVRAQLTLESCQEKARANYPLIKQFSLIEQTRDFTVGNAAKGYLPQISFSARVSYQSDVTEIPVTIPTIAIEGLTRDQYQAVAEVSQVIWDGGIIRSQEELANTSSEVEKQKLEVDLYTLKERVNQLFFSILLINEHLRQNDLLQKELQINYDRITACVKNGVAGQADLDAIKVEQLKAGQRRAELHSAGKTYRELLSAMNFETLPDETVLVTPDISIQEVPPGNLRPELQLFDAQMNMFESQKNTLFAANRPKIGAYLQTGFGKPGLNMLKNEFSPFYVGGVRLSWNLNGFYTLKNNAGKIEMNRQAVETQKETFLFNNNLALTQHRNETAKIRELISRDDEIIQLRGNIKRAAEARVENGTLSVSELIREVNAEDLAKQEKALHEIQLLMSVYQMKNITNN